MECPELEKTCKCGEHKKVRADRQRLYRRRRAERNNGFEHPSDLLPIAPVRRRLRDANRKGVTFREMEKLTGISKNDLQRMANSTQHNAKRKQTTITRANYERITHGLYETDLRAWEPTTLVPIKKSAQVVCSLSAQGWSQEHVRHIVEKNFGVSGHFVKGLTVTGRVHTYKKIEDLLLLVAKHIGTKTGPAKKSSTWARKNGHFPLMHYDSYGDLIESSLSSDQRASVQSSHD